MKDALWASSCMPAHHASRWWHIPCAHVAIVDGPCTANVGTGAAAAVAALRWSTQNSAAAEMVHSVTLASIPRGLLRCCSMDLPLSRL